MKLNIFLVATLLIITSFDSFAQAVIHAVLPLSHLNNFWVYDNDGFSKETYQIADTAKYVDSIKYVEVEYQGDLNILLRLREDSFYVMRRSSSYQQPNHEQIYYKKDAQFGDQWTVIPSSFPPTDTLYYSVIDTLTVNIYNTTVKSKLIYITNHGLFNQYQVWTEEFGRMAEDVGEGFNYQLKGCIIDGVLYGDTTTTTVDIKDEILDLNYSLSQNYPNPFNPATTISYRLEDNGTVRLVIYDIKGEKVTELVNTYQQAGYYEVDWDTKALGLSSGVYLFRIEIKDENNIPVFTDMRKSILLK